MIFLHILIYIIKFKKSKNMKSTILWPGQNKIMVGLELPPSSLKKPNPPPNNILLAKNEDIFLHGTFYFFTCF